MCLVNWALLPRRERLFEVDIRGVEQDLILYVWQLVLPNVPVDEWIFDLYIHGIIDGPDNGI